MYKSRLACSVHSTHPKHSATSIAALRDALPDLYTDPDRVSVVSVPGMAHASSRPGAATWISILSSAQPNRRLFRAPLDRVGRRRHGPEWGAQEALEFVRRGDFAPSELVFDAAFLRKDMT